MPAALDRGVAGCALMHRGGKGNVTVSNWIRGAAASCATLIVLGVMSATAAAAPVCDTYTGADNGVWATGTNWSDNAPPTSGEIACLNGMTVDIAAAAPVPTADHLENGSPGLTPGHLPPAPAPRAR